MAIGDPLDRWAHESVVGVMALAIRDIQVKLDLIMAMLDRITGGITHMSKELDDLAVKVAETITVEQSAIVLIQGLAAQLAGMANDPAAIMALADSLKAKSDELAAAVAANPVP